MTAIVIAPGPLAHSRRVPQVTVGVFTQSENTAEVTIQRNANPRINGTAYTIDTSTSTARAGEAGGGTLSGVRAGDRIEIQLAVSEATPANPDDINAVVAARVVDLRTGAVDVKEGHPALLKGAPNAPTRLSAAGEDAAVTEGTWAEGWPGTHAGLDNQANPPDSAPTGVSQRGKDFFITDRAHPHKAVAVGTVRLATRTGDRVVTIATTTPTGDHTQLTVIDRRSHQRVESAG